MPRHTLRLCAAALTFALGVATVSLSGLGSRLAEGLLERLAPALTTDEADAAVPPDSTAEAYEVYNALLNGTRAARERELLVVIAETGGNPSEENGGELRRSFGRPETFVDYVREQLPQAETETLEDYLTANREMGRLVDLFRVRTKVVLATEGELKTASGTGALDWYWTPGRSEKMYPNATGVFGLSAVGFNRRRTQAFVYFWHTCGGLCGGGSYVLLEKRGVGWRVIGHAGGWVS